jgi:hypothetical protein
MLQYAFMASSLGATASSCSPQDISALGSREAVVDSLIECVSADTTSYQTCLENSIPNYVSVSAECRRCSMDFFSSAGSECVVTCVLDQNSSDCTVCRAGESQAWYATCTMLSPALSTESTSKSAGDMLLYSFPVILSLFLCTL